MANSEKPGFTPCIQITPAAVEKLREVIAAYPEPAVGLRLKINGRSAGTFEHGLTIVEETAVPADDPIVETDGLRVYVEAANVENLDGVTIDFADKGPNVSGLEFTNPNPPWRDPIAQRIQQLFDDYVNPGVAGHGGHVTLIEVKDGRAYVEMGGGCQGCGMASVTLKQGIEVAVREAVPEIQEVIDVTDHAEGSNPYYQPAKDGAPSK